MPEAVIVAAARSPIGRAFKGSLREVRPDDLATTVIRAVLDRLPSLDATQIDDLYLGCAEPCGEHGMNMARVVAVLLGLDGLPASTVNRFCASSVQTTRMAYHAIRAGEGDVFISAGVECVSRYQGFAGAGQGNENWLNPAFADAVARSARTAGGMAEEAGGEEAGGEEAGGEEAGGEEAGGEEAGGEEAGQVWSDPRADGHLPDVYIAMGQTAENVAAIRGVSRRAQDEWGVLSQNRAEKAQVDGVYAREIIPVSTPGGTVVERDDSPRSGVTLEAVEALQPVFREGGTVTAGNCCPLNDGAAALVVMSDTRAQELGLTPLARVISTGVSALSPEIMGLGPVEASRQALARARMSISDIDLVEINEAFAAQVLPSAEDLGIDHDQLNVHGGAIALGHPFGMTGARIATTLLNALQLRDGQFGLETMCVGGGQGMAIIYERLN